MTGGLHSGDLFILAGRPSMGKTALALNVAQHVALKLKQTVAIFSLEMSKESLLTRMLCAAARVDSQKFRAGYLNQDERRKLNQALHELVEAPLYIDDTAGLAPDGHARQTAAAASGAAGAHRPGDRGLPAIDDGPRAIRESQPGGELAFTWHEAAGQGTDPHQRSGDGPVRAHADHRRRRLLRKLPRRLHGAHPRRKSVARGGRGADRARQCADQVLDGAELVPGDKEGRGGIYNFVTKRGKCLGVNSKISWTQVETGSAITWKYPSCILQGDNSVDEFYSVALTNNRQQADTGTKMIHIGKNTRSTIVSKGSLCRLRPEHLPRPGQDPQERDRRAQLHAMRFAA